jgi:amino acid transporter
MNPFDVTFLWRAVRGYSLTFAALFSLGLLGFSYRSAIRGIFEALSLPWIVSFMLPFAAVMVLVRYERRWLPDVKLRRRLALGTLAASAALALALAIWRHPPAALPADGERPGVSTAAEPTAAPEPRTTGPTRHGPPGRR